MTTGDQETRRIVAVSALVCAIALAMAAAGLFVSSVPVEFVHVGYLLFVLCLLGAIIAFGGWRTWAFWALSAAWVAGVLWRYAHTRFSIHTPIDMMVRTSVILLPMLALGCYLARREGKVRYLWIALIPLFGVLGDLVAARMDLDIAKSLPSHLDDIRVSDDGLADKHPAFVDEESMWAEATVADPYKVTLNKSAAVVRLDVAALVEKEKKSFGKVFPTYRDALQYARRQGLPVIPSVQMVDQCGKAFADRLYAAVETYAQSGADVLGGGKQALLKRLLARLIETDDASAGHTEAIAYVAAALRMGGAELPPLPADAEGRQRKMESDFLRRALLSKPIGFYTRSEELKGIFRQDRFCQNCLSADAAIAIARVLNEDAELRKQYRVVLSLYDRLTNPASRFSADDVADYPQHFGSPEELRRQMLRSEKWKALQARGALDERTPCIQLIPHSTSQEGALFVRLYPQPELPQRNIMNDLIRAIRSGELDLTPKEDSGWYDYQIHALETLLVPEKGQEGEKLLLTKRYKERLLEAFRTMRTKSLELHVKRHYVSNIMSCVSMSLDQLAISPDLTLEPTATYYLRTARGFRFVLDAVEVVLGKDALDRIQLDGGGSLRLEGERMVRLYYGLYLRVCDDIGMKPQFMKDEITPEMVRAAQEEAAAWLKKYSEEKSFEEDVRYIVPALANMSRTRVKYWMTVGVRFQKIKADYVRGPRARLVEEGSGKVVAEFSAESRIGRVPSAGWEYRLVPSEYFLPVEVFAEAEGPANPMTREEFRALCDRLGSKEAIVRAVEGRAGGPARALALFAAAAAVLVLGGVLLVRHVRRKARASKVG